MAKSSLNIIILAAGRGTRMKSSLPKVLHPVAGQPMLARVLDEVKKLMPFEIRVVLGHGKSMIEPIVIQKGGLVYEQKDQLGTAHAVMSADPNSLEGEVLILNGDHPLISHEELKLALKEFRNSKSHVSVLTCKLINPKSFGRIIRKSGVVQAIVEAKDASPEVLKVQEVNTGAYILKAELLKEFLSEIKPQNKQREYYLTDVISLAAQKGILTSGIQVSKRFAFGVNDQLELSRATKIRIKDIIKKHLDNGVIFINPESVYIEEEVSIESGAVIYPNVFLKGKTSIAAFCVIEPNCFIQDSQIMAGAQIKFGSHLEKAIVGSKSHIGPYARLRPETIIGENCRVGNFVEMKKVTFGNNSKANHLTYLGDAKIGKDVNIGCGTITCNYAIDKKKYETLIGDDVFVGSDTQFVAPVQVGDGAIIGSGSTITKNVPSEALAVARAKQVNIEEYASKLKKEGK